MRARIRTNTNAPTRPPPHLLACLLIYIYMHVQHVQLHSVISRRKRPRNGTETEDRTRERKQLTESEDKLYFLLPFHSCNCCFVSEPFVRREVIRFVVSQKIAFVVLIVAHFELLAKRVFTSNGPFANNRSLKSLESENARTRAWLSLIHISEPTRR